jgi:hypothetical protein
VLVREDHPGEVCRPDGAGCGSGQRCEFALAEDELVSACRPTCSVTSACPDAMVCASGPGGDLCLARCDPARPTCPGRESCVALDAAGREWGCRLMPFAERPGVHVSRARGHFSDPTSTPL